MNADPSPPADTDAAATTPPALRQFALQAAAAFAVLSLAWPYYGLRGEALPWPHTALAIGAAGLVLASLTRQRWWWRAIHALFAPAAWAASLLAIDPGWFLAAAIALLLVYRGALTGQIPLYLSNRATAAALAELTPRTPGVCLIDLGAGVGSVLAAIARLRRDIDLVGVENAPATWLAGFLRTRAIGRCDFLWRDLWRVDLGAYDVVYAFLSPAPMPQLWQKVRREMRPGSIFVSNSFAVPDATPSDVIEVGDARGTRLYCYRV